MNTLDSIRAAFNASAVETASDARVALLGYSGGAIASEWVAELAPTYAPDVNARSIGAAIGGVLVHPAHNQHYIENTYVWAGVMPMALIGIARRSRSTSTRTSRHPAWISIAPCRARRSCMSLGSVGIGG